MEERLLALRKLHEEGQSDGSSGVADKSEEDLSVVGADEAYAKSLDSKKIAFLFGLEDRYTNRNNVGDAGEAGPSH